MGPLFDKFDAGWAKTPRRRQAVGISRGGKGGKLTAIKRAETETFMASFPWCGDGRRLASCGRGPIPPAVRFPTESFERTDNTSPEPGESRAVGRHSGVPPGRGHSPRSIRSPLRGRVGVGVMVIQRFLPPTPTLPAHRGEPEAPAVRPSISYLSRQTGVLSPGIRRRCDGIPPFIRSTVGLLSRSRSSFQRPRSPPKRRRRRKPIGSTSARTLAKRVRASIALTSTPRPASCRKRCSPRGVGQPVVPRLPSQRPFPLRGQ